VAGITLKQLTSEQQDQIQATLDSFPSSLQRSVSGQESPLNLILPDSWQLPAGIRHLLIVPDAWISYVPFDLLHAAGSRDPLIESYDISYLPSAVLLRRKSADSRVHWPWTRELVAFGHPVVATEKSENQDVDRRDTQSLAYSATEIQQI